jgi:hypothetical protein
MKRALRVPGDLNNRNQRMKYTTTKCHNFTKRRHYFSRKSIGISGTTLEKFALILV